MSLSLKGRKMDLMQSAVGICWTGNKASLMREEFKELPMVCRCMSNRGAGEQKKSIKKGKERVSVWHELGGGGQKDSIGLN